MRKVILTGADGFIGRNLANELLKDDYLIYAVVRDIEKARCLMKNTERVIYISCEMKKYENLLQYSELREVEQILHFAWSGVSDTNKQGYVDQLENVKASCDLMHIGIKLGIKKFLFAGSLMEFEHKKAFESGYYKVSERNIYHVAKNTARNMLQIIANNHGINFQLITISNVYGVGEKSSRLINTAIRNMLKGQKMSFTLAEQNYDFIYIEDAVRAIKLVAEVGKSNKNYYIGNKEQRPLKNFLYELRDTVAPTVELGIGELPYKGVSLEYNEFDTNGLYDDFHFNIIYDFREGIKKTAEWIKKEEKL